MADNDLKAPLTLAETQQIVDRWMSQWKEGYWPPLANLARLSEEVGELAREINHVHGPKTKKSGEAASNIAMELGDVLFVVICLANSMGIDLETAFEAVMQKYDSRDHARWKRHREL